MQRAHQGTSRFLAQGGGGGGRCPFGFAKGVGILKSRRGIPIFFTNNMIFLECVVIALFEAFYMFRDHNHVKSFEMLNNFISSCSAQVTISQEVAK